MGLSSNCPSMESGMKWGTFETIDLPICRSACQSVSAIAGARSLSLGCALTLGLCIAMRRALYARPLTISLPPHSASSE